MILIVHLNCGHPQSYVSGLGVITWTLDPFHKQIIQSYTNKAGLRGNPKMILLIILKVLAAHIHTHTHTKTYRYGRRKG